MESNVKYENVQMGDSEYDDPKVEKVITNKDLHTMVWKSLLLQASFNYERMQAGGWLYGMQPALKKIHKSKKDLSRAMKDHLEFFNTHPFLVTFIMGLVTAMEENKENRSTIRAIKVATMGPLGGIGDALFWLTALPICAGIGASLAGQGNMAGPIIFLIAFNVLQFALRFGLMSYGYNTGIKAIANLKEQTKKISHAASIVGLTVVGGLIASMVKLQTTMVITAGQATLEVQKSLLDKIMPNLLSLIYTLIMYKLLKKGRSPIILICVTVVFGILGRYIGFL